MRKTNSIMTGVAIMAALSLPMVAGAANKLVVNGTDGTTPMMVVTDTGAIGSGTSAPTAALNIVGATSQTSQICNQFSGVTTASGGGGFLAYHNNAAGALPSAGDRLGYFLFGSFSGSSPLNSAGVSAKAEATWTASPTYFPSYFAFETTATNTRTEKMRITGAGNVGIGTGTPTQKLQIVGGVKLDSATKPTCDSTVRGTMWYTYQGAGLADLFEICSKDAAGAYAWRNLIGP